MAEEITRRDLRRALVLNALTKPVNVVVAAVVVVAGVAVGAAWLLVVALAAYATLATLTFFDEAEARRVGDRAYGRRRVEAGPRRPNPEKLAAPIASQYSAALEEETRIHRAIAKAELPFSELDTEVTSLVEAMGRTAQRAQSVFDYLASQDPRRVSARIGELERAGDDPVIGRTVAALREQLSAQHAMQGQLNRFYAEMEQTVASLSTIHAEVVRMGLASEAADQDELAGQVRDLRAQVDALSQGMHEAYARGEEGPSTRSV